MSDSTYSVYLVERGGEQGGQREVTSPIGGNELEFYDTGVWLNRDRGRNFFPYEQIRTIREHAEGETAESEGSGLREDDTEPEAVGDSESTQGDETQADDAQADDAQDDETQMGDTQADDAQVEQEGAEEEMLE